MEVYAKAKIIRYLEEAKEALGKAQKEFMTGGANKYRELGRKVNSIQIDIEAFEHKLFNQPTTKETQP